jgi:hypothetical protein
MGVRFAIWILSLALLSACEQSMGPKYERKASAATDRSFGDGTFGGKNEEKKDSPVAKETPGLTTPTPPNAVIAYPSMHFRAQGNVESYDNRNQATVHMDQTIDDKVIVSNITKFSSTDSFVHSRVQELQGPTTYTKASSSQLTKVPGDFMFFATSASAQKPSINNQSYTKPLPFAVVPKELAGYSEIAGGKTLTYDAYVNPTQNVGFNVQMSVKRVEESNQPSNMIIIELKANIPTDDRGKQYETFLIPYKTRFYVDHVKQKIVQMHVENNYHHRGRHILRKMTMPFLLCTYTIRGQSTPFNEHLCRNAS